MHFLILTAITAIVAENDVKGIYSTWQAAVESITISMDDFSGLKLWMARFDETRQEACDHILDTLRLLNDD